MTVMDSFLLGLIVAVVGSVSAWNYSGKHANDDVSGGLIPLLCGVGASVIAGIVAAAIVRLF